MGNRYKIIKLLKKGSITDICYGYDNLKRKYCLIKLLNPSIISDKEIVKRFEREAKILKKLNHKNIVKFYDFVEYNGTFALVLEYIEGITLKEFIQENKNIDLSVKLFIIHEILKGISYLHKKGVLHRDLKPSNVLISRKGEVKIGDFGLSIHQEFTKITNSGELMGTPSYIAPEIFEGKKYSPESDIFSLGVVFYELFAGFNPFSGDTLAETMSKILTKKQKSLYDCGYADNSISSLIEKMLEKKPEKRFRNAYEILNILKEYERLIAKGERLIRDYMTKGSTHEPGIKTRAMSFVNYFLILLLMFALSVKKAKYKRFETEDNPAFVVKKTETIIKRDKNKESPKKIKKEKARIFKKKNITQNNPKWGYLKVNILPWAEIIIDDSIFERTPVAYPIKLKEGIHRLLIKNPEFPVIKKTVKISLQDTFKINIDIKKEVSYLKINILPWAEVVINNTFKIQTPVAEPLILPPGSLRFKILNPYYKELDTFIFAEKGDTILFNYNFQKNEKNLLKNKE